MEPDESEIPGQTLDTLAKWSSLWLQQQVCERMSELAAGGSGGLGRALTVPGVAAAQRLPVAVAQRQLLTAEAAGTLCRDEGAVDGLRFYRNFFTELQAQA